MKKFFKTLALLSMTFVLSATFSSCEKDSNVEENTDAIRVGAAVDACNELGTLFKQVSELISDEGAPANANTILARYVDAVVVPTYKSLAEAAIAFRTATEALKTDASATKIKAAADAWMTARIFWEKSEAFLFGPVSEDAFDIDAHIDSWPLEKDDIDRVLTNDAAGLTGQTAWLDLEAEVIGFHTTEYLLFRDGKARNSLTPAEVTYLTAATDALVWDCALAYVAWAGTSSVSTEISNVFNENSDVVAALNDNDNANYRDFANKLKNATGKYEGSFAAALSEISDGAADIADEVGATKIESPFVNGLIEEVESWYSWHSLDDYQNNIKSIKNAYYGEIDLNTPATNSLSAFVASKNASLDNQIKAKITDCITKIAAIGAGGKSFYEVVRDNAK
jgi:predicted lipoprotein